MHVSAFQRWHCKYRTCLQTTCCRGRGGAEETSFHRHVLAMRRGAGNRLVLPRWPSGGDEKLRWAPQDDGAPWWQLRQLRLACRGVGIPPYILPSTLSANSSSFSLERGAYVLNTHARQQICTFLSPPGNARLFAPYGVF